MELIVVPALMAEVTVAATVVVLPTLVEVALVSTGPVTVPEGAVSTSSGTLSVLLETKPLLDTLALIGALPAETLAATLTVTTTELLAVGARGFKSVQVRVL